MDLHSAENGDATARALQWRAYHPEDLVELRRIFDHEDASMAGSALRLLGVDGDDPYDALVATDTNGVIQALSLVTLADESASCCVGRHFATAAVVGKPLWRAAVDWQLRAARNLLYQAGAGPEGSLEVHVHPGQVSLDAVLRANGFSWYNSTIEMTRDLKELPEMPDLGHYMRVEKWEEGHVSASRRLLNRLLAGENDEVAISKSQWQGQCDTAYPEWSHVLIDQTGDRPTIQGFVLASAPSVVGGTQPIGVIDMVAVADTAGSSEYFHSLTLASLISQKEAGVRKCTVIVEEPGDPFTTRLYQNLGFEPSYEVRSFTTKLP